MKPLLSVAIIIVTLFGVNTTIKAQKYLLLRKVGKPYSIIYNEGESMRFRLKGERFFTKGLIQGFGKDDIRFHYYRIKLDEIAEVDVSNKNFTVFSFRSGPGKLVVSGLGYLLLDQFNQTVIRGESLGVSKQTAIVSGALTTSGFVLKGIQKKRFKMRKKKHVMEIIDI